MSDRADGSNGNEKIIMATHCSHCHGTCLLKVHVVDDRITRIETDDGEEPQYRACAKGRAYRQRVYAPDRILHPLKRVGERGEGRFERISWDEALDTVAGELKRVINDYGPSAILHKASAGDLGRFQNVSHERLLSMIGGCSEAWASASSEGAIFAQIATFGTVRTYSSRDTLRFSKLVILWACNPAATTHYTNTVKYLLEAREAGVKIISVDPRYTNTTALLADQWIPIRPGTDTALMVSMAHVMIDEGLHDRRFLDTYTHGFEKFRDYVMGVEDGIPKTPRWAEAITGVPAATIASFAREYATAKPAALLASVGPGRTACGEQYHRAAATLAAMTANVGVLGGDSGVCANPGIAVGASFLKLGASIPHPGNPVEARRPPRKNDFPSWGDAAARRTGYVHHVKIADAILKGKAGGYPADYRLLYPTNTSFPNQYPDINKSVQALKSKNLEFVVAFEQFMTPLAQYADVVLPVATCLERNDITLGPTVGFYGFMGQAIEPVGEAKSHFEICKALATRMGIEGFSDKTEDEWLRQIALGSPDIADYEAFKQGGGFKVKRNEPYVAFKAQIEDPEHNPFPTPAGKIEIYCQRIADMGDPRLPAIPKYVETWESVNDPLAKRYPLQLITTHFLRRAHTQYETLPWMRELEEQAVKIHVADAGARGIGSGDQVRVFNDRGATVLPAYVTERIMPGVVDIPQGAWYHPDANGVDRGGSANVLTRDEPSPGGALASNTCLVQVERFVE